MSGSQDTSSLFASRGRCHKVGLFAAQDLQDADVRDARSVCDGAQAVALVTRLDDRSAELLRDGSAPLSDALHSGEAHLAGGFDSRSQLRDGVRVDGRGVGRFGVDPERPSLVAESVVRDCFLPVCLLVELHGGPFVGVHAGNLHYHAGDVKRAA